MGPTDDELRKMGVVQFVNGKLLVDNWANVEGQWIRYAVWQNTDYTCLLYVNGVLVMPAASISVVRMYAAAEFMLEI